MENDPGLKGISWHLQIVIVGNFQFSGQLITQHFAKGLQSGMNRQLMVHATFILSIGTSNHDL